MGGRLSSRKRAAGDPASARKRSFTRIADRFSTVEEVQEDLRRAGLESSNLIFGVDFTRSNEYTGKKSFHGRCLHWLDPEGVVMNPYESVISIVGRTLEVFDDDKLIPAFGFGDTTTTDKDAFSFFSHRPCHGFQEVLQRYRELIPIVALSGPTSFAPLIRRALEIVKATKQYHILVIVGDGEVIKIRETTDAIVEASNYPLSIVMIGVGDGPWETMEKFDDELPERRFDNFQFVEYNKVMRSARQHPDATFALAALMEIPDQYRAIRELGLLES